MTQVSTPLVFKKASGSSLTISFPAFSEGDLLIAFVHTDSGGESDISGFTEIHSNNSTNFRSGSILAKIASESDENPFTLTNSGRRTTAHCYAISGVSSDLGKIEWERNSANGAENPNFNPPPLTHTDGEAEYVWFATCASNVTEGFSAGPENYTSELRINTEGDEPEMSFGTGFRILTAATENPGAFTSAGGSSSLSYTLAIPTDSGGQPEPTPGLPATTILDKDGNPLTSTQVAVTVMAGATTLYDDTPTTDGSGLLPELDFSAHGSEPEVDDEVTWTITAGGITQSVTRTLVDLGD